MNDTSPAKPITSGTRICADDQGKLMPPIVKAMATEHVDIMAKALPL
jgi:hypothetical protein